MSHQEVEPLRADPGLLAHGPPAMTARNDRPQRPPATTARNDRPQRPPATTARNDRPR
jgi:hypothetical protein